MDSQMVKLRQTVILKAKQREKQRERQKERQKLRGLLMVTPKAKQKDSLMER